MRLILAVFALLASHGLASAQCPNGTCARQTVVTQFGMRAPAGNVVVWDIVGRGPTQVRLVNGQAFIVNPVVVNTGPVMNVPCVNGTCPVKKK